MPEDWNSLITPHPCLHRSFLQLVNAPSPDCQRIINTITLCLRNTQFRPIPPEAIEALNKLQTKVEEAQRQQQPTAKISSSPSSQATNTATQSLSSPTAVSAHSGAATSANQNNPPAAATN